MVIPDRIQLARLLGYANWCVPPRTVVRSAQVAISGRVLLFSTIAACHHLGMVSARDLHAGMDEVVARWGNSVESFLSEAADRGLLAGRAAATEQIAAFRGPVIGSRPELGRQHGPQRAICTDLGFTVELLARVYGNLLLPLRKPQLTWARLFDVVFALDDSRVNGLPGYAYPNPEGE